LIAVQALVVCASSISGRFQLQAVVFPAAQRTNLVAAGRLGEHDEAATGARVL
jgi:hypothetical protein